MHANNIPKLFFLVSVLDVPITDIPKKDILERGLLPPWNIDPRRGIMHALRHLGEAQLSSAAPTFV